MMFEVGDIVRCGLNTYEVTNVNEQHTRNVIDVRSMSGANFFGQPSYLFSLEERRGEEKTSTKVTFRSWMKKVAPREKKEVKKDDNVSKTTETGARIRPWHDFLSKRDRRALERSVTR